MGPIYVGSGSPGGNLGATPQGARGRGQAAPSPGRAGPERAAGILQTGIPAAIPVAIIAAAHDIAPGFVTAAVLFSTLAALPT